MLQKANNYIFEIGKNIPNSSVNSSGSYGNNNKWGSEIGGAGKKLVLQRRLTGFLY